MQSIRTRAIVPIMGKHSRRKSGYLPKIAAGAAPVAFLFAAPTAALATQPLDYRTHDGRELHLGELTTITTGEQRLVDDGSRAGAAETRHTGVWLPNGVDVLSENAEQVEVAPGGVAARRSAGQGLDLGALGAIGAATEQHGSFTGSLDVGQKHEVGGQLGPASGLVKASQSQTSGSFSGDLGVDHVVHVQGGTTSLRGTLAVSVLDQPALEL